MQNNLFLRLQLRKFKTWDLFSTCSRIYWLKYLKLNTFLGIMASWRTERVVWVGRKGEITLGMKVMEVMCVMSVCVHSRGQLSATPSTVAHQAPLSIGFSRQEYCSGLPFPPPRDLPNPGIKPMSLATPALTGGFFTTKLPGKLWWRWYSNKPQHAKLMLT